MRKEDWGSINIEYVPYETDELYKKINTQEDKNYCTYELVWEMERQYIGNGRFYANESIEFNLKNARPFNHKHDDYIEFIRTHKNCTIRITSVNKTKKQVVHFLIQTKINTIYNRWT